MRKTLNGEKGVCICGTLNLENGNYEFVDEANLCLCSEHLILNFEFADGADLWVPGRRRGNWLDYPM